MSFAVVLLDRSRDSDKVSPAKFTAISETPPRRSKAVSILPTQLAQSMPSTRKPRRSPVPGVESPLVIFGAPPAASSRRLRLGNLRGSNINSILEQIFKCKQETFRYSCGAARHFQAQRVAVTV